VDALKQAWAKLEAYPLMQILKQRVTSIISTLKWSVNNINFRERFINVTAFIVENGYTIATQTASEAQHKQMKHKTYFYINMEEGKVEFNQKLPASWRYFNEKPKWQELKEWKIFNFIKKAVRSSGSVGASYSILDFWYKHFSLQPDPSTWLPPFHGGAQVVGQQNLVSWNGKLTQFKGLCRHLLAADLVSHKWAVVLNYHATAPNAYIVYVDGKTIELEQNYDVKLDGRPVSLPVVLDTTVVYRNEDEIRVHTDTGLDIVWNQQHDVFTITLAGMLFAV